ncbi:Leucine-rich_repeat domain superfamily [Hexamita inflata]|uniref:Leucine-rich repeat domain superfamily n=1 Tax=Hexamita inflata TaxID=28002 RepID=A0AA86NBK9_9EUKA|nr:Leucine-rich repeat domain superfamily [Hexamita inflata]
MTFKNLSNMDNVEKLRQDQSDQVINLQIKNCGLISMNWVVQTFYNITTLDCSGNKIKNYSALRFSKLLHLYVNNSFIQQLTQIPEIQTLQTLNAVNNDIQQINCVHFPNLRLLNLQSNKVRSLKFTPQHYNLQIVNLLDNPIFQLHLELQLKSIFPNLASLNHKQLQINSILQDQFLKTYFQTTLSAESEVQVTVNSKTQNIKFVYSNDLVEENSEILFDCEESVHVQFYLCGQMTVELPHKEFIKIPLQSTGQIVVAAIMIDSGVQLLKSKIITERKPKIISTQILGEQKVGRCISCAFNLSHNHEDLKVKVLWERIIERDPFQLSLKHDQTKLIHEGNEYQTIPEDGGHSIKVTTQLYQYSGMCDSKSQIIQIDHAIDELILFYLKEAFLINNNEIFIPQLKQLAATLNNERLTVQWDQTKNSSIVSTDQYETVKVLVKNQEIVFTQKLAQPKIYPFELYNCSENCICEVRGSDAVSQIQWFISDFQYFPALGVIEQIVLDLMSCKERSTQYGLQFMYRQHILQFTRMQNFTNSTKAVMPSKSYMKLVLCKIGEQNYFSLVRMQRHLLVTALKVRNELSQLNIEIQAATDPILFSFELQICVEVQNKTSLIKINQKKPFFSVQKALIYKQVLQLLPEKTDLIRVGLFFQVKTEQIFTGLVQNQTVQTEISLNVTHEELRRGAVCVQLTEQEDNKKLFKNAFKLQDLYLDKNNFSMLQYLNKNVNLFNENQKLIFDAETFYFPLTDRVPISCSKTHQNIFIQQLLNRNLINNKAEMEITGEAKLGGKIFLKSAGEFGVMSSGDQTDEIQTQMNYEETKRLISRLKEETKATDLQLALRSANQDYYIIKEQDLDQDLYFYCFGQSEFQLYKLRYRVVHTPKLNQIYINSLRLKNGAIQVQLDATCQQPADAVQIVLQFNNKEQRISALKHKYANQLNTYDFEVYIPEKCPGYLLVQFDDVRLDIQLMDIQEQVVIQKQVVTQQQINSSQQQTNQLTATAAKVPFPINVIENDPIRLKLQAKKTEPKSWYDQRVLQQYNQSALDRLVRQQKVQYLITKEINRPIMRNNKDSQIFDMSAMSSSVNSQVQSNQSMSNLVSPSLVTTGASFDVFKPDEINQFDARRAYQQLRGTPVDGQYFSFQFTFKKKLVNKNQLTLFRASQNYFEQIETKDQIEDKEYFLVYHKGKIADGYECYITYRFSEYDIGFNVILRVHLADVYHYFILNKTPVQISKDTLVLLKPYQQMKEPSIQSLVARSGGQMFHSAQVEFVGGYISLLNNLKPLISVKRSQCRFVQYQKSIEMITPETRYSFALESNTRTNLVKLYILGNVGISDMKLHQLFVEPQALQGSQSRYFLSLKFSLVNDMFDILDPYFDKKLFQQHGGSKEEKFSMRGREFFQAIPKPIKYCQQYNGFMIQLQNLSFLKPIYKLQYRQKHQIDCIHQGKQTTLEIDCDHLRMGHLFKKYMSQVQVEFGDYTITFKAEQVDTVLEFAQKDWDEVTSAILVRGKWGDIE